MSFRQKWQKWRHAVFNVIRDDDVNHLSGTVFDSIIIVFIFVTVAFVVLDTFQMPAWFAPVYKVVETISITVFTLEYILRIWTIPLAYPMLSPARARLKYIFSPMAMVDLLSVLPFFLPLFLPVDLSILQAARIIRLLRIFKIKRYTNALDGIAYVFKKRGSQLFSSVLIIFLLMLIASVLMFEIEHTVQPDKFDNALSAFWWAVATVTTVGYGDMYPITPMGRLLGSVIALLGIGLVAIPTGIISAGFVQVSNAKKKPNVAPPNLDEKCYCPYCGHRLD